MATWRFSERRLAELEALLHAADIRWDALEAIPRHARGEEWAETWRQARADFARLRDEVERCRLAVWRRERQARRKP